MLDIFKEVRAGQHGLKIKSPSAFWTQRHKISALVHLGGAAAGGLAACCEHSVAGEGPIAAPLLREKSNDDAP